MTKPRPRPPMILAYVFPPIPRRDHDWCAFRDGEEERQCYGWGSTPDEAIQDLLDLEDDGA